MNSQQQLGYKEVLQKTNEHILVVDDDLNLCQTIQVVLEEEGFRVKTALDGVEALEQVERVLPAMVVLDMGLPLLDGEAVAKELRVRYGETVPVVLMTADGHVIEKGQRVCAVVALGKPFELDDLINAVYKALAPKGGEGKVQLQ
jgi:DNA-binding response OmpR family regulator